MAFEHQPIGIDDSTVVTAGNNVGRFAVGDQVFGSTGSRFGAYAEYIALPARYPIIHKPGDIPHLTATTIPVGGVYALHFLQLAQLQACKEIPIVSACGCIGTAAITRRITDKRVITKLARVTEADFQTLCKQIGKNSLEASIDTTHKLEEVVEAHRDIDAGNKKGQVAFVLDTAAEQQTKDQ